MPKRKYNNHKTEIDGLIFDSRKEGERYLYLKELQDNGKIKNLELQKKFLLIPKQRYQNKAVRECNYIADFCYERLEDNVKVVEDVKGYSYGRKSFSTETPEFKIKRKLFILHYGSEYEFNIV